MNDFKLLLATVVDLFRTPLTLYTFTFSWWQVFFWSIVAGLIIWFIKEVFS